MTELAGKRILITGGAGGLGRRTALEFAARGAELVLWDLDEARLEATTADLLEASGRRAHGYVVNVMQREMVYATARQVEEEVGPIDIVVNNAGIVSGRSFLELSDEAIERTFGVNTLALFWVTRAFLPGMLERNHGHVVTIASASGWVGVARLADYAASKWAAVGFDESLRMELRQKGSGVRTTCICPFYINTGMFDGVKTRFPWLLPILEEKAVAARIVKAVERNEARVMLPPVLALVPVGRFLPTAMFDALSEFLGVNATMDEFKGRRRADTEEPEATAGPVSRMAH
jgi:all-trans-retinol dehydrogenase (NAD+)